MRKINCWEFHNCGRQPGGQIEKELGPCQVATFTKFNKINGGVNGGRYCWNLNESLCEFQQHGTFDQKEDISSTCDFKKLVQNEESSNFVE